MRPDIVEVLQPRGDDDLCFTQRVEELAIQLFVRNPPAGHAAIAA
jgi:hypothetical protein